MTNPRNLGNCDGENGSEEAKACWISNVGLACEAEPTLTRVLRSIPGHRLHAHEGRDGRDPVAFSGRRQEANHVL